MSQADRAAPSTGREGDQLTGAGSPVWDPGPSGRTRLQFQGRAACGRSQAWAQGGLFEDGAPVGQEGSPEPPQPSPSTSDECGTDDPREEEEDRGLHVTSVGSC